MYHQNNFLEEWIGIRFSFVGPQRLMGETAEILHVGYLHMPWNMASWKSFHVVRWFSWLQSSISLRDFPASHVWVPEGQSRLNKLQVDNSILLSNYDDPWWSWCQTYSTTAWRYPRLKIPGVTWDPRASCCWYIRYILYYMYRYIVHILIYTFECICIAVWYEKSRFCLVYIHIDMYIIMACVYIYTYTCNNIV